jgi:hypothetical protein
MESTKLKQEIDRLWEEHLEMVEKNRGCLNSPQKEKAISLMRKLLKEGNNEDRKWVREREIKTRVRAAEIYQAAGKLTEASDQLNAIQRILDLYPEIDRSLGAKGAQPTAERNLFSKSDYVDVRRQHFTD